MKLLALGEIIWDIYPDEKHIGGAPLNLAAHAALLGNDSYILSAVGSDLLGDEAMAELARFSVKTDYVKTADRPTGQCIVTLDGKGVPHYDLLSDMAYDYLSGDEVFDGFDVLCFGTLIQRSEQNIKVIKDIIKSHSFGNIFCDLNLRKPFYNRESIVLCAENANVLKISREELCEATLHLLGKEIAAPATAARAISAAFPNLEIIIITLDCDGAFLFDTRKKTSYFAPAKKVKVKSTVGAGDSFSAAFLSSYIGGDEISAALEKAVERSAFVVSKTEAIPL